MNSNLVRSAGEGRRLGVSTCVGQQCGPVPICHQEVIVGTATVTVTSLYLKVTVKFNLNQASNRHSDIGALVNIARVAVGVVG